MRPPPRSTLFPYTTLFRSHPFPEWRDRWPGPASGLIFPGWPYLSTLRILAGGAAAQTPWRGLTPSLPARSEEHTSELQSRFDLVCRLLLEKKKQTQI